jgi:Mor family transcriptional regulator
MDIETPDNPRGTQFFYDLARLVGEALEAAAVAPEQARLIGLQAAEHVRQTYGGEPIYVPKGLYLMVSERDRAIYRAFDGGNHHRLAKEHSLTVRQIYSIVARVREEDFQRRQMSFL